MNQTSGSFWNWILKDYIIFLHTSMNSNIQVSIKLPPIKENDPGYRSDALYSAAYIEKAREKTMES